MNSSETPRQFRSSLYIIVDIKLLIVISLCVYFSVEEFKLPTPSSVLLPLAHVYSKISDVVFSERELKFMFAICHRPSVCLSSVVCNVGAPYSDD